MDFEFRFHLVPRKDWSYVEYLRLNFVVLAV